MINYRELRWSNCFSYGPNNKLRFDSAPITQIVGKNGHGKSSIGLILEEILYNKNSKNIKKGAILNRHCGAKQYQIALDFDKDGSVYTIETTRGSTQKVSLHCNGEDISSHTATGTFKDIESLIGYDHKTFSQIIYQSSTTSLEFLTATDTQRKKFLIDLLNLGKYTNALEVFKAEATAVGKRLAVVEGKINQAAAWIEKYAREDLNKEELEEVPTLPMLEGPLQEVMTLKANIVVENKQRTQNAQYLRLLTDSVIIPAPTTSFSQQTLDQVRADIAVLKVGIAAAKAVVTRNKAVNTSCPTCGTALAVDHEHIASSITNALVKVTEDSAKLEGLEDQVENLLALQKAHKISSESVQQYEKYHSLYNPHISTEVLSAIELDSKIADYQRALTEGKALVTKVVAENNRKSAKNARIDTILSQRADMIAERDSYQQALSDLTDRSSNLAILVKAFGTTGLIAYKIEGLVKDLESITNEYLGEMSDGRFLLSFQINSSDKLNVVITDNGEDVDINALSSGERARVNIATLLAIRRLMQSLSNTRSNLLILDETVENLDAEGKEKLIEVLVKEQDINTFLISHGFTHPLLEKLHVIKTNNISRIEV